MVDVVDSRDPDDDNGEPRRDRLPQIVFALALGIAIALVGAAAYLSTTVSWHWTGKQEAGSESTQTTSKPAGATATTRHLVVYAGLTRDQAATFAASDFAKLLGGSGSGVTGSGVATDGQVLARTRCLDGHRWTAYWRVSFVGGSPVFESRRRGLLVCNKNPRITVSGAELEH